MPDAVALIIFALVVMRVTGLVVQDAITERPRNALINALDDRDGTLGSWLTKLITCSWCASMWVAAALAPVAYFHYGSIGWQIPALIAASSQVAGMTSDVGR